MRAGVGGLVVAGIILATTMAWGQEDKDIPLGPPAEIIKMVDAPAGMKVAITKEKAIELAGKYSGFGADKGAEAKLVVYTDPEKFEGRTAEPELYQAAPAWLVHLPNASYKVRVEGGDGVYRGEKGIECPMQVAIHAQTGQFMVAIGDSKEKWAQAPPPREWGNHNWSFAEPREAPTLTVKDILKKFGDHRGERGQFFVRYATMKYRYELAPKGVLETPEFPAWVYSVRGAILRGFSVPTGYQGPPPYATRSDFAVTDRDVTIEGHVYKAGTELEGQRY